MLSLALRACFAMYGKIEHFNLLFYLNVHINSLKNLKTFKLLTSYKKIFGLLHM